MASEKERVCKNCGYFTVEKECPLCRSNQFLDKYKGQVVVFNSKESMVAEKLEIKNNGKFALKYG